MIFSVFIRNIKVYQNINYIPVSDSTLFSAFVGENGVGKSAVLEALDSFFNSSDWNYNHNVKSKGFSEREPYICPVFLLNKEIINKRSNIYKYLNVLSDITWQLEKEDFNRSNSSIAEFFCWHRDKLLERISSSDEYFLFPIGIEKLDKNKIEKTMSIFSSITDYQERIEEECDVSFIDCLDRVYDFVSGYYKYIYIPSDIDIDTYTRIEGETVQSLMGKNIEDVVKGFIEDSQVKEINSKLDDFMQNVSVSLEGYEYKRDSKRQNRVNITHLTNKIIEAYFDNKVLNLKSNNNNTTPVKFLSSGEKRNALIDVARAFLLNINTNKKRQVIFAIDEPEISLHIASCFKQFSKLKEISSRGMQVLITTHWYGFMPVVSDGATIYMPGSLKRPCLIDMRCFIDDIKVIKRETKGMHPANIELKGLNDFVQSIIASITSDNYNWIICEGISDKIYLDSYLNEKGVIVLPVGKSKYVKKIYKSLYLALEEDKESINGKVFLLLDTDKNFESDNLKDVGKKIVIRRLQNNNKTNTVELKKVSDNSFFPSTEIEDVLEPEAFMETLAYFISKLENTDSFKDLNDVSIYNSNAPSGLAFNMTQVQLSCLEDFFNIPGMKVNFALHYKDVCDISKKPNWIESIESFFQN